jgi:alkylated DNA nucleotide flippase Atl1
VDPSLPSPYAERMLDLVEQIPSGRVLAYGDIAELLAEGGPRQVGRVMALWGGAVPWWRVVRASGQPALGHELEALEHLLDERTPMAADGSRVDMQRGRAADLPQLRGLPPVSEGSAGMGG